MGIGLLSLDELIVVTVPRRDLAAARSKVHKLRVHRLALRETNQPVERILLLENILLVFAHVSHLRLLVHQVLTLQVEHLVRHLLTLAGVALTDPKGSPHAVVSHHLSMHEARHLRATDGSV